MIKNFPFISKYQNTYFYFDIQDGSILRTNISYPSFDGKEGVVTQAESFSFSKIDATIKTRRLTVEVIGRDRPMAPTLQKMGQKPENFSLYSFQT